MEGNLVIARLSRWFCSCQFRRN